MLYIIFSWYSFFKIQGYDLSLHFLSYLLYNYFHNGYTHVLLNFPLEPYRMCALTQMGSFIFHYFFLFVKDLNCYNGLCCLSKTNTFYNYSTSFSFVSGRKFWILLVTTQSIIKFSRCIQSSFNSLYKSAIHWYTVTFPMIFPRWMLRDCCNIFYSLALRLFLSKSYNVFIKLPKCSLGLWSIT